MSDSRADKSTSPVDEPGDGIPVPRSLRVGAAVSWRFLVIVGALTVLGMLINRLAVVVIPVAIALLLSALLAPGMAWLTRRGVPRGLATAMVVVGGLAVVGGVLTFVISAFSAGIPELRRNVIGSIEQIRGWLRAGPLHVSDTQIDNLLDKLTQAIQQNQDLITSGALTTASTIGMLLSGLALALFSLIFLLHDGRGIWRFCLRLVPQEVRHRVDVAGVRSFSSLVGYVRATTLVAIVDALGIGVGLAVIGVPLVVPLAALVFLGGFVPIVGAFVSGLVAVLVALVAKGFIPALLVLAVVIGVQQLEGHVLQPLLLGRAVQLHALAVVLAIATGVVVAGIPGALLAVPLVAVLNSAIRSLNNQDEHIIPAGMSPPAHSPASEEQAEGRDSGATVAVERDAADKKS